MTPSISMQVARKGPAEYAGSSFIFCSKKGIVDPSKVDNTTTQKSAIPTIRLSYH